MAGMHVCWVLKKPMNQLLNKFLPVPIPPAQQAPELSRGIRLFFLGIALLLPIAKNLQETHWRYRLFRVPLSVAVIPVIFLLTHSCLMMLVLSSVHKWGSKVSGRLGAAGSLNHYPYGRFDVKMDPVLKKKSFFAQPGMSSMCLLPCVRNHYY